MNVLLDGQTIEGETNWVSYRVRFNDKAMLSLDCVKSLASFYFEP